MCREANRARGGSRSYYASRHIPSSLYPRVSGYSNWFSVDVGGGITLGYVHSIVYPKVFLTNLESVYIVQARAIENALA